ncbi:MAG: hydrogenase small subunit [Campylobacterales bacterium]
MNEWSVERLYTTQSNRIEAKDQAYYDALYASSRKRLDELRAASPLNDSIDIPDTLAREGLDRRDFMKWVSATTATLMLPAMFEPLVAEAAELFNRVPVIWTNLQDCAGNSEAILRTSAPSIDELILEVISLEFHEVLMAAAGHQAEKQLEEAMHTFKGRYILAVEGSIPLGMDGQYGTKGPHAETMLDHLKRLAADSMAIVAMGSCAAFGGVPAAYPNPTNAVGVKDVVSGKPIINLSGCPVHPHNITSTIIHVILTGQVPALDNLLRPRFAYGYRIHDNCERRAHFDAGHFVEEFGDFGAKNNWCLYKVGCKGPMTFNNCSIIRFNDGANWPVGVGRGCIGCAEPDFWDKYAHERPVAGVVKKGPLGGVERSVDMFGLGLLTAVGIGIAVHATASVLAGKKDEGETK